MTDCQLLKKEEYIMKKRSLLMFAALTAIFFLFGTAAGQIPLPVIPGNNTTEIPADVPAETPVPEWIQTQEALQMQMTDIAETQEVFSVMQTQAVWNITLEAFNAEQTRIAQTQVAIDTQAAVPTHKPTATPVPTNTPKPTAVSVKAGDIITFGHYEQDNNLYNGSEPIEWRVLVAENGLALLISIYGLDAKPYHEKLENITWEKCSLREWLNEEFYNNAFDSSEKSRILQVTIKNPGNLLRGTDGGIDTKDRIFLLNRDEANRYFTSNDDRKCRASDYAKENGAYVNSSNGISRWWLRSPGFNSTLAAIVDSGGYVSDGNSVSHADTAVRPAFWLDL